MITKFNYWKLITENPDRITIKTDDDGIITYDDIAVHYDLDAYPFGYLSKTTINKLKESEHGVNSEIFIVGPKKSKHNEIYYDDILLNRKMYSYPGRVWTDKKLISFWEYPDDKTFKKIIKELENHFSNKFDKNFKIDDSWKVEVLVKKDNKERIDLDADEMMKLYWNSIDNEKYGREAHGEKIF